MTESNRNLPKLANAIDGKVVTRFPPEASGFLHLGHVKALLINYLYAKEYNGKIILRFDDTNPDKENQMYEEAILEDIRTLGMECDEITYTSDYFGQIEKYAIDLISTGMAYMDFGSKEEINETRRLFKASPYRDTSVEENLVKFNKMLSGECNDGCLRAKIDYRSKNGCLRDPVIYRAKNQTHPRHRNKYHAYPTYDFACPILDAMQGVTHAMRSVEYRDRDAQYQWFLQKLSLGNSIYPILSDYGKLNFSHTVLSKRKLSKLVSNGLVSGWDDPRMPTVRGIIRRGVEIQPLLSYIRTQAMSRSIVLLTWEKLWSFNTAYLDGICVRLYGISSRRMLVGLVSSVNEIPEKISLPNHPKKPELGNRLLDVTDKIWVETDDFINVNINDKITLLGLGNTIVINLDPLVLHYDENDKDFKNSTKITWLPNNATNIEVTMKSFGHLLSKAKVDENEDIVEIFNRDSVHEENWLIESSLQNFIPGTPFQLMRVGYCQVDENDSENFVLHMIPTPKSK